jgi:hypothetical protein
VSYIPERKREEKAERKAQEIYQKKDSPSSAQSDPEDAS